MHHKLLESVVLSQKLLKNVLNELDWRPVPVAPHCLLLHLVRDLCLQNLAAVLVTCEEVTFFNKESLSILLSLK